MGCRENELMGGPCCMTSHHATFSGQWQARQQYSARGGRRQLMQGVSRASMVSNLWHFHHVALPQHNIELARCCLVTALCVSAERLFHFGRLQRISIAKTLHFGPFRTTTDLHTHTGYPWLIVN